MPSSGSIVSVKFRISSGFGKFIFIVLPRVNSCRSSSHAICQRASLASCVVLHSQASPMRTVRTSLHAQLRGRNLFLLLSCGSFGIFSLLLLLFLHVMPNCQSNKSGMQEPRGQEMDCTIDQIFNILDKAPPHVPCKLSTRLLDIEEQKEKVIFSAAITPYLQWSGRKLERSMRRVTRVHGPAGIFDRQ